MTRLRATAFLVAASTTLVLAPAASAGLLGLKVSPAPGRTAAAPAAGVGAVDVHIVTPVVETHLQVSTAGAAATVAAPQVAVEASVERTKRKLTVGAVIAPKRPAASAPRRTAAAPPARQVTIAEPLAALARLHTPSDAPTSAAGGLRPVAPASGPPGGASLSLETVAAAGGACAALAGVVLVAFLLLSQVLRGLASVLRPPLLSFDLQRPG